MLKRLVPMKASRRRAARTTLPVLASLVLGLTLVVLAAYSAVRPAAGQETFPEPSEIVSKNGVLQAKLTAEEQQIELAGTPVSARVYNGAFVGPTFRLNPGDTLDLELVNHLPEPTNLHFHGTHVSPSGNSDNVLRHRRRETAPYELDFPPDHAPGTYWYHSHEHGICEEQVFGGMSGVIVVQGLDGLLPADLRDVKEQSSRSRTSRSRTARSSPTTSTATHRRHAW